MKILHPKAVNNLKKIISILLITQLFFAFIFTPYPTYAEEQPLESNNINTAEGQKDISYSNVIDKLFNDVEKI